MKLAILDDYQRAALTMADWSPLDGRCAITVFDRHLGAEAAAEALAPFDIVSLVRERQPMPRALIERLPNLKLIAITGAHNRTLDLGAATERGIAVSFTTGRGVGGHATPELTWALVLAAMRQLPGADAGMRQGGWQTTIGTTLYGKTLGVLGLGRIGRRVAAFGKAFGMEVIAWSQNLTDAAAAAEGVRRVDKDQLFAGSDVLSIHVVLSERSRGLVGAREIGLMKPTARLINTSRGPIIDEAALIDALRARRIAGAGLDVYDIEPLPADHPLRALDNAVLTPHLGYVTEETYRVFYEDTVENIAAFLDGRPIRLLNPEVAPKTG